MKTNSLSFFVWSGLTSCVVCLQSVNAQIQFFSDFNDGVPDWTNVDPKPFPQSFTEENGQLRITATFPATSGNLVNSLSAGAWTANHPVRDGETIEYQVDLVQASSPDVMAGLNYQADDVPGEGQYTFLKSGDEVHLTKVNFNTGTIAAFFRDEVATKHANVILSLALTGIGDSVSIKCSVLDKDNGNAVLYERTVVDSPGVDPTVSSWPELTNLTDDEVGAPVGFNGSTSSALFLAQLTDGNKPEAQVVYDNFTWQYLGPEIESVEMVNDGIKLWWSPFSSPIVVEGSPSVNGPWTQVTEPTVDANGMKEVTIPVAPSNPLQIFRLKK